MTNKIADKQLAPLYERSDGYHQARINGCRAHGATAWIQATPFPYSKFTNEQFRLTCFLWLGLPICQDKIRCRYCDVMMDKYGAHASTCKHGPNIVRRHNRIRNYLYRKMKEAGYACELEKKKLDSKDGKRPADIYVHSLINNKPTAIDVSVTSSVQKKIVRMKTKNIYEAADRQVQTKLNKYEDMVLRNTIKFIPFVIETFGGFCEQARNLLRRLAHDLREKTKRAFSVIMSQLQKCICVRIWKSTVEAVQERTFWRPPEIYDG